MTDVARWRQEESHCLDAWRYLTATFRDSPLSIRTPGVSSIVGEGMVFVPDDTGKALEVDYADIDEGMTIDEGFAALAKIVKERSQ